MTSPAFTAIQDLQKHLAQHIIGQEDLLKKLLITLLADGHLLVEGAPGLAKTKAIKALAAGIEASFHRVQFTPDLLPGDITGTDIYRPQTGEFVFQAGPIFHNLLLADEINRAPAKVQSALLEAMGERQVTIGKKTYELPELFLVMATQNPLEQEGTYPLPEAQLDRFLMYVRVNYPSVHAEQQILQLNRREAKGEITFDMTADKKIPTEQILQARKDILEIHMSPALEEYIVQLVVSTRDPRAYSDTLAEQVRYGASPRATIALDRCARSHAWLSGRDFVAPEDIHAIIYDVLRHRIILSYEAEAEGITTDDFISELLQLIVAP